MKKGFVIYENLDHKWIAIARDPERAPYFIDTNEYLIIKGNKACMLDPGGIEIFPSVFSVVGREINTDNIEFIIASHQDPDIVSSLSLWLTFNSKLKCYVSWVWGGFIPHYGCTREQLILVPDEGLEVSLNEIKLQLIPAHYMHSPGNFHVYDPVAKILFTGDVGAALVPESESNELFVKDFSRHVSYMKEFHQRWMPSNEAKNEWIERISKLDIQYLCPQHGCIFSGENVHKFLEWFRELKVGVLKTHS